VSSPLVCILAAGRGTRISAFGGALHKSLLPLGRHPVITQIIREFPPDARFVVALGHKSPQLREYLELAHPDASMTFVDVDPYEGPGSGPGRSLWACRELLAEPFVLTACDSLCTQAVPSPTVDWMGVHPVAEPQNWCTVVVDEQGAVQGLHYKDPCGTRTAFVGVAGIATWDVFFDGLAESLDRSGEVQVDAGFEALVARGRCITHDVGWLDTGTDSTYRAARAALGIDRDLTFDGKETDVTFHVGARVVKVFLEPGRARRVGKRLDAAHGAAPKVLRAGELVLAYEYVDGTMFDEHTDERSVLEFLTWAESSLWRAEPPPPGFVAACTEFYFKKTRDRLATYLSLRGEGSEVQQLVINGRSTASVERHLGALAASDGFTLGALPSRFHGDLHGGNIVRVGDAYRLIDWRDDFGGIEAAGDRYYDLAKFLHTLELSVDVMRTGTFSIDHSGNGIVLSLPDDPTLLAARRAFWKWTGERYDPWRVAVVDALIFVNMAPIYAAPLRHFLYFLGRLLLDASLSGDTDPADVFELLLANAGDGGTT
jgi:dTDP-glucose pyrophosphorylase